MHQLQSGHIMASLSLIQIKYPQILNAQKIGSDAYGVSSIPELILFDPDGKIVKRGLRGPAIRETIQEVLKK